MATPPMTTVHPEEARPGVVNTDEEVLHTFSIDANMWEEYQKGSAHMHVYDGCPHFYRNVGCIPSPFHICCGNVHPAGMLFGVRPMHQSLCAAATARV